MVGGGSKLIDSVYIDNAAHAHLLALDALQPGAACAGKAYFITQGEPMIQRELINGILKAAGLPLNPEVAAGASIPLVLWAVWRATLYAG